MKRRGLVNGKRLYYFYIVCVLFIKLFLVSPLRIFAITNASYDDAMMVNNANSLLSFNWLGQYSQFTLAKGIVFPIYLTVLHKFSISYLLANNLLCFLAALSFVIVISKMIRSRILLAAMYTVLMFNPITYAAATYQRVYRDSIYQYLVILLFSFIVAVYFNKENSIKRLLFYSLGSSIFLPLVWFTREDSLWVIPFVGAALVISACFVIFNKKTTKKALRLLCMVLPILTLLGSHTIIANINYKYYGVFITNDYIEGNFPKAYKALSLVKPVDWQATVPVTKLTREKIYAVSPSFAKLKPYLEKSPFETSIQGNANGGAFPWALRDSVSEAGIKDAKSQQIFYQKLANEINNAVANGKLEGRSGYIFTFVSPWDNRYLFPLKDSFNQAMNMVINFEGISLTPLNSTGNNSSVKNFELITNSPAYYASDKIFFSKKLNIISNVSSFYTKCNSFFFIIGMLGYCYITIKFVWSLKLKKYLLFDEWIILTGLIMSFLIRLILTSYTSVSSFSANNYMYLAVAYWIILIFTFLSIFITAKDIYKSSLYKGGKTIGKRM